MVEIYMPADNLVLDEEGFPQVFEVDFIEEYGPGTYSVEFHPEFKTIPPEPGEMFPTWNSTGGYDMIVKKDGDVLPLVVSVEIIHAVDDIFPHLRGLVYRKKQQVS